MKRYRQYTQVYCDCTIQEHVEGEWVKWQDVCKVSKTKEFCEGVCCNRDEYNIFQVYGKECPNCPVDSFMDYYGLGDE
jgi:hypothetical protein